MREFSTKSVISALRVGLHGDHVTKIVNTLKLVLFSLPVIIDIML